ncbi:MAG: DUF2892 domain-containing protein [Halobacteriales archaeon]
MDKNVGGIDRTGRLVIGGLLGIAGLAVLGGFWALGGTIGLFVLIVGAILLVTGTTQKCPINAAAGLNTTKRDR